MLYKLELLQNAILENWNKVFFYSDIDIIFLKPIVETCIDYLGDLDFVVQQGWPRNKLCAGFFVMRGNEKTLRLIKTAYKLLQEKICIDDQIAIQKALRELKSEEILWDFLPSEQFANGRRVMMKTDGHYTKNTKLVIPNSLMLFHANCCIGLENKYHFINHIKTLYTY